MKLPEIFTELNSTLLTDEQGFREKLPKTFTELNNGVVKVLNKWLHEPITKELFYLIRNSLIYYLQPFVYHNHLKHEELMKISCDYKYRNDYINGMWIKVIDEPTRVEVIGMQKIIDLLIERGAISYE